MTTLEKLGIQGIRSFGKDHLETLTFQKPLTLIVGHNGAGKTTIVECLKMACTGELPPSADKGKAFIYDPKLAVAPEVKAQIRLLFKTVSNKKMCVVRSFQLTHSRDAKGKLKSSFKALESVLQTKTATGEVCVLY
ncbi:putative Dna repair protein RAD50 [Cardiosporidium cionae]|uniref:Dna repair protein RAD50 n=1 Tax=Cardiosporidium cionae TaxID=476202 RepID=A0ABQ7JDV2_9APIC|nr:putative Dna repair protein RAD50 [Cardiosporidium cionae]|eukprot:KAF8822178.1 putative Dna repair protein RAD50 [Cardiosporidium cionae]